MKKLATIATLSLLATPVFAAGGFWTDNPDSAGHILNDDRSAYIGTGMSSQAPRESVYGSLVGPDIEDGFKVSNARPEEGMADQYGSVLHEAGTPFQ